jgi:hypothetical protein
MAVQKTNVSEGGVSCQVSAARFGASGVVIGCELSVVRRPGISHGTSLLKGAATNYRLLLFIEL